MHGTSQGTPVPLSTFGGLATIADPNSLPEGASPRNYDMDFDIGSTRTRDGLTNAYTYTGSSVGPLPGGNATADAPWVNPSGILVDDGSFASTIANTSVDLFVTQFGFDLPSTSSVTGVQIALQGFGVSATIFMRLMKNGVRVGDLRAVALPATNGTVTLGGLNDMWGNSFTFEDINNVNFGIAIAASSTFSLSQVFLDYVTVSVGVATGNCNFNWIGTFTDQDGTTRNLSQDANGNLWVENVTTNPGQISLALSGITANSFVTGVTGQGVEYLAFNDLFTGSDVPRQYTSGWIDKITQVGPGASPVFSSSSAAATSYAITSITQPAAMTWGFTFNLQSAGPGSNTPGNTVTIYYADSTIVAGPDADLVAAFATGLPVYLYLQITNSSGGPTVGALTTPYTALVTSAPSSPAKPNGQSRPFYYFTYQMPNASFVWNPGDHGAAVTYQRSQATLTTAVPVPQLVVGDSVVITGNTVAAWNTTWPISANFNSGSMAITQTSLSSAGVGTYSYTVTAGTNPQVGQLVTITGTLNGNGAMNVVNNAIATVSGGASGTFTINLLPAGTSFPAEAESGQAITAGTLFGFDPGIATLGGGTSPIHGNGTGGSLTVTGSGQIIGAGTRQGVVFFITRNGYWTAPSPPVTFTTPDNTTTINASNIPIGPPNVIKRGIAFTEAGQNGVPGANFFTIPTDVVDIVQNVSQKSTSLIINDNTTTNASFSFTDFVLLNAEAIDVQGFNLFNLIEIGNPGWIVPYDSRNFYGLCQNKVQNFTNMSFDGGYLNPGNPVPLGWTAPDQYGTLLTSPIFGNSYYIANTTGILQNNYGQIFQTAYQDAYQQPIINPNTTYSIRVTCRNPSGNGNGNLVVQIVSGGVGYGSLILSLGPMTATMQTFTAPFILTPFDTVPTNLQLTVYGANFASGADCEIDRIEIFPTEIPILTTSVFGSYANEPEAVDAVTGQVKFISENQQPVNGAVVMYDTFYGLKDSSMYSLRSQPNLEPAQWDEPEVAQRAGASGILAYDFGEQWIVSACRNGLYLYEGGQPGRIMPEIYQVWNAINWNAKHAIWVKNDVPNSRLFIGIPLPTPNFWLPNAPVNANPTTPNVILMCNYLGVTSGEGIKGESAVHVTMFGTLEAGDMRRKWSLWQIPAPYASFAPTSTDEAFYICNGSQNSKVYILDPNATTDDGVPINSSYCTYGFVDLAAAAKYPMLGLFRKRWGYLTATLTGTAAAAVRFLGDKLLGPGEPTLGYNAWSVPGGIPPLTDNSGRDRESTANFVATRTFLEFSGTDFNLSNITMYGKKDTYNAITGAK